MFRDTKSSESDEEEARGRHAVTLPDKSTLLILAALVGVKILLLSFSLWRQRPWTDEITTLIHTQKPTAEILGSYYNHMTYVLLAKVSALLFDGSVFSLRIPAAILGVVGIPCAYLLGKTIYSRETGFLFALFLVFLPEYHLFSQESRGYIGVMVFLPLAASLVWRSLASFSVRKALLAAFMVFVAFLLHPIALLFVPGLAVFLATVVLAGFVQRRRGRSFHFHPKDTSLTSASIIGAFLVPLALFFIFYGAVTRIPGQVQGEEETIVRDAGPGDRLQPETVVHRVRRPVDLAQMVAPFVSARNHTGPILTFGLVLCILGIILPPGLERWGSLLLMCVAAFPIAFFYFYQPAEMPQRYLTPCLPFFVLLMIEGLRRLGRLASGFAPCAFRAVVRGTVVGSLMCVLVCNCLGPLAMGIKFGTFAQGAAWPYSLSRFLEHPELAVAQVGLASKKWWFWQKQLAALGVERARFLRLIKEEENWSSLQPSQVEGVCESNSPTLLAFVDSKPSEGMDAMLRQGGFESVDFDFVTVFFRTVSMVANPADRGPAVEDMCMWADSECGLDYQFYLSAARLANELGVSELGSRFDLRAKREMKERVRFDFPNNTHTVRRLARHYLETERTPEALEWYCYGLDRGHSGFHVFTSFIEDLSVEEVEEAIALGLLDPDGFARDFIQRLRSQIALEDPGRAYWAYRGGEDLYLAGDRDGAARLLEYSVLHGDTQDRARKALIDLWLKFGDPLRAADRMFAGVPREGAVLKDYTVVFERLPKEAWKEAASRPSFDAEGYVRGLREFLDEDTELGEKGKAYWAYRAGEFFVAVDLKDCARSLFEFSIAHGGTDGRAGAALRHL